MQTAPKFAPWVMKASAAQPADGSTATVDVSDSSTSKSPSNTPNKGGIVLEFEGFGGGKTRTPPSTSSNKNDRPWRKPASAVKAEREASAKILGGKGGVFLDSVRFCMAVQEVLDARPSEGGGGATELQEKCTYLLQCATNNRSEEEVTGAEAALKAGLELSGLTKDVEKKLLKPGGSATAKLQLLHEVMPRLWVGGWAALNDDCAALKQKKVTHVVSVLSADQRRLPDFIKGHLYIRVDDTEEAADALASRFEDICKFIEEARSGGGIVFVHCGAGISRAPTSTCSYLMWKMQMGAADAIKLCRSARPCTRPNVGFVAALKAWEAKLKVEWDRDEREKQGGILERANKAIKEAKVTNAEWKQFEEMELGPAETPQARPPPNARPREKPE